MPQSPISRTESGSVSAIKNFLFGGVLDPSRPHPDGTEGEGRRQGKSQIFKVPILRSQVFRPQVFKSQIVKTKVQRGCEYKTVELDDNFPNNLRSGFSHAGPAHRFHLPKLNNVTSSSSNLRWPAATPLNVESKELPQYASTPNLSCDLQEAGTGGYRGAGATGTGTLPRNLHLARTQRYLPGVLATAPLPSSSSSSSSSCAHSGNTTLDSGFHSDATWTDTDSQSQQDAGAPLPQDVPEYRRGSWDVTPSVHGPQVPPRGSRRKGKQVSSVILKIEKGLFATASKDSTCEKPPRARDRRPIDPSSATLPLPPLPSSPPPPLPPADSKEEERGEEETTADFKTASISPGGTFLARSNHESGEDGRDIGSPRHAPERRESGRFPSAARLLRSLGRSNRDDSGSGAQGRDSDARLSRANPSYHSEGKGLKKKNNWTSERELNHSLSPTQKERSHSFCEKSNSASKRRYSYHDNKTLREESRGRLERQESNQGGSSTLASPAHSLDQSQPPTSTPLSSQPHQPPICTSATTPPPCTPSPAASSSSSPSSSSSSSTTPTLPKSVSSQPPSPIDNSPTENIYENLPPRKVKSDTANSDGGGEGGHGRVLERGERERRSSRKLTKDSGYETSPYSESDYANIDLYSEVDASGEVDGDGDDVTLAPESELASPPSPSASRHPDSAAAPIAASAPDTPRQNEYCNGAVFPDDKEARRVKYWREMDRPRVKYTVIVGQGG
ncbi:hypothetical protein O3P69_001367 [Scylla paramamosain]|uniref:Uncharacterized protein n=1 Tax=Scylla paramamosain TaxID=85552 RepID=A0AAW0UV79_SCYPA